MPDQGVDQLRAISKRLKDLGNKGLSREFTREVAKVMKPLRTQDLPASARSVLPRHGGLNEKVAKTKYRLQRRTGSRQAGIRLLAKYMYHINRMDKGQNRHPVPNTNRRVWVTQRIEPGWFTKPTEASRPQVLAGMNRAMSHMVAQIEGKERAVNGDGASLL